MEDPVTGAILPPSQWTGLFPDMIAWIAEQAGFTYSLVTTSGQGSSCSPSGGVGHPIDYARQYGCTADDVLEEGITDVYMGAYYVTQSRLQRGLMSTPFDGKSGLAVFQVGRAESIPEYIEMQKLGRRGLACTLVSAAYTTWLGLNLPELQQYESLNVDWVSHVRAGICDAFIVDRPIGDIIVSDVCDLNLVGGEPLAYGYHDYALGMRADLPEVAAALSYWISYLRTCSPVDPDSRCYGQFNMYSLITNWTSTKNCPVEHSDSATLRWVIPIMSACAALALCFGVTAGVL
eukprot:7383229-Prymnesium_polylepis.1